MSCGGWPCRPVRTRPQDTMVEGPTGGPRPRAVSERPQHGQLQGPGAPRAASTGPTRPSFRDQSLYESGYECVPGNDTGDSNQAIRKLEQAVRSIDQVLAKDISKLRPVKSEGGSVQYDSITVLPIVVMAELPPPPLPRTRSFRESAGPRARAGQGGPWGLAVAGTRASSAPPVSPVVPRRFR